MNPHVERLLWTVYGSAGPPPPDVLLPWIELTVAANKLACITGEGYAKQNELDDLAKSAVNDVARFHGADVRAKLRQKVVPSWNRLSEDNKRLMCLFAIDTEDTFATLVISDDERMEQSADIFRAGLRDLCERLIAGAVSRTSFFVAVRELHNTCIANDFEPIPDELL